MASLRQRKDRGNRFQLHYVCPTTGKRYRIDIGTSDLKVAKHWQRKAEELISQAKLGLIEEVGRIDADIVAGRSKQKTEVILNLEEFQKKYEERCRHDLELAEGTIATNNNAFNSFREKMGNLLITAVTDEDVMRWKQKSRAVGHSPTTLSIYHRALRAAFNRATRWEWVSSNPFQVVEVAKKSAEKKSKHMSIDEVQQLLRAIDEAQDHQFAFYIRMVLYTGCRRNEILYLRWEEVDLEQLTITIYAQKTDKVMVLPINKALRRVLGEVEVKEKGYIFRTNSTTKRLKYKDVPWNKNYVTHRFKVYARACGLSEDYHLHSLRHTYSTHLIQKGIPLDIVQKLLGHSSPRVTADNYDHSIALHFRSQADLVDFEEGFEK